MKTTMNNKEKYITEKEINIMRENVKSALVMMVEEKIKMNAANMDNNNEKEINEMNKEINMNMNNTTNTEIMEENEMKNEKSLKETLTAPVENEMGGVNMLEMLMLLVIIVALVAVFKEQIINFVNTLFGDILKFDGSIPL